MLDHWWRVTQWGALVSNVPFTPRFLSDYVVFLQSSLYHKSSNLSPSSYTRGTAVFVREPSAVLLFVVIHWYFFYYQMAFHATWLYRSSRRISVAVCKRVHRLALNRYIDGGKIIHRWRACFARDVWEFSTSSIRKLLDRAWYQISYCNMSKWISQNSNEPISKESVTMAAPIKLFLMRHKFWTNIQNISTLNASVSLLSFSVNRSDWDVVSFLARLSDVLCHLRRAVTASS